ncbi:MAG: DNA polymerase [Magnetococcus sp. YQC-9]
MQMTTPPFAVDEETLFVAYYASAELGCFLSLGWPLPANILDLCVEFRNHTNGLKTPCGSGLLGALIYHGLEAMGAAEKESMRQLAIRGGPWTNKEKADLLVYCEDDVKALVHLLPAMEPKLDIPRALLRGRYMKAAARMEYNGTPIDLDSRNTLQKHWDNIKDQLIQKIDSDFGVYEGHGFRTDKFEEWLVKENIAWPRHVTGRLDLSNDTFKKMSRIFPWVGPLGELRASLSKMRLADFSVGADSRNRCLLSVFGSETGRNQPSNNKFIFGPSVWLRGLIKPEPGMGLAYIDWSQQEFGIAAALSGDSLMMDAYRSGDAYLGFAKQAGAVPQDATKQSHKAQRDLFKECALGVQYRMGTNSLAMRIGQPAIYARELIRLHKKKYQEFWKWSEAAMNYSMLHRRLWTVFGWTIHVTSWPAVWPLRWVSGFAPPSMTPSSLRLH